MQLYERCMKVTGRKYPDGYGFALIYLDDTLNPAHLRDAACALVAEAYATGDASDRKDSDLVAFVNAYASATSAEGYLIEAAQFVLGYGMAGNPIACNALALCGHPGYAKEAA